MLYLTLAQVVFHSVFVALSVQTPTQDVTQAKPPLKVLRSTDKQEHLCCYAMHFVEPIYPKEARLSHIEGVVKLDLVIADDGSVAELQPISGDPLLVDSAMTAVRQWRVPYNRVIGRPIEHEIALTFTFRIEEPPKPAYLHLANGEIIRADTVREFTDGIEYTVSGRAHHISPDSVTHINACARAVALPLDDERG